MPPLPLLVLVPPPLLLQALPPLRPPVPSVLALPQPPLVLVALLLTTVAAPLDATVVATLARLEVPRAGLPTVARMLVPPQPLKLALPQQSLARLARPLTPVLVALQLATVEARPVATVLARLARALVVKLWLVLGLPSRAWLPPVATLLATLARAVVRHMARRGRWLVRGRGGPPRSGSRGSGLLRNVSRRRASRRRGQRGAVDLFVVGAERDDAYGLGQVVRGQKRADRAHRDQRRTLDGEAEGACADRRERDTAQLVRRGDFQRALVAAREQRVLVVVAAAPDRPDGVNDVRRWKVVAAAR